MYIHSEVLHEVFLIIRAVVKLWLFVFSTMNIFIQSENAWRPFESGSFCHYCAYSQHIFENQQYYLFLGRSFHVQSVRFHKHNQVWRLRAARSRGSGTGYPSGCGDSQPRYSPDLLSEAPKANRNLLSLFIAGLLSCHVSELNQLLWKAGLISIKRGRR